MDSALRPRDIQARIRAGESVEDVAAAAGVPVERIDAFAAPVLAERDHVAGLAQANPVRRRGETSSNRLLRNAASEQLISSRVDPDAVTWDAHLIGARRWQVQASFAHGDRQREALFVYDVAGRFSVAENDDARWLIGEWTPAATIPDETHDDRLALLRAVADAEAADLTPAEVDDAYTETELAEVDGVYDIVPGGDSDMDALYDMLASFDEDSVKIYSGLVHPDLGGPPQVLDSALSDPAGVPSAPTPELPEGARVEPLYVADDVARVGDQATDEETADEEPITEPEQPALVEDDHPAAKPKPGPPKRRPRASVPSWDEIMFGSPRQGPGTEKG